MTALIALRCIYCSWTYFHPLIIMFIVLGYIYFFFGLLALMVHKNLSFHVMYTLVWRFAFLQLLVFEDLEVPTHKTKNIVSYVRQMEDTKKLLLVDGGSIDEKLKLATQNLHYVNVLPSIVSCSFNPYCFHQLRWKL